MLGPLSRPEPHGRHDRKASPPSVRIRAYTLVRATSDRCRKAGNSSALITKSCQKDRRGFVGPLREGYRRGGCRCVQARAWPQRR
jgi:hypothetical protein